MKFIYKITLDTSRYVWNAIMKENILKVSNIFKNFNKFRIKVQSNSTIEI